MEDGRGVEVFTEVFDGVIPIVFLVDDLCWCCCWRGDVCEMTSLDTESVSFVQANHSSHADRLRIRTFQPTGCSSTVIPSITLQGLFGTARIAVYGGHRVAIKKLRVTPTMDAGRMMALRDELASDLPVLQHPNIAHVIAVGVRDRSRTFRLEGLGDNRSLRATLTENRSISWFKKLRFMKDIAEGKGIDTAEINIAFASDSSCTDSTLHVVCITRV